MPLPRRERALHGLPQHHTIPVMEQQVPRPLPRRDQALPRSRRLTVVRHRSPSRTPRLNHRRSLPSDAVTTRSARRRQRPHGLAPHGTPVVLDSKSTTASTATAWHHTVPILEWRVSSLLPYCDQAQPRSHRLTVVGQRLPSRPPHREHRPRKHWSGRHRMRRHHVLALPLFEAKTTDPPCIRCPFSDAKAATNLSRPPRRMHRRSLPSDACPPTPSQRGLHVVGQRLPPRPPCRKHRPSLPFDAVATRSARRRQAPHGLAPRGAPVVE